MMSFLVDTSCDQPRMRRLSRISRSRTTSSPGSVTSSSFPPRFDISSMWLYALTTRNSTNPMMRNEMTALRNAP